MDNEELVRELRKRAEEWRGKARANEVVDGPEDAYRKYVQNADALGTAAYIIEQDG